jgi:LysW-gamma-L-lysine carboxypeptidase
MSQPSVPLDQEAVDFLEHVLRIPSPSGSEVELAHYLTTFLENNGFKVLDSPVGNVIGVKGSGAPVLLLASHMDTVVTDNPFRSENGNLYATGAVDCKGSLASMLYAGAKYPWKEGDGTLILAGMVHEETDDAGIQEFLDMNLEPDFAIFGEPTKADRLCVGYRGRVWTKLTVSTESGHSASAWEFENSILVFHDVYQKIANFIEDLNISRYVPEDPNNPGISRFNELSVTLSTINAGSASNVLPKTCTGDLDFRIPPWITAENFTELLKIRLQAISAGFRQQWRKPIKIEFQFVNKTEPVIVGSDNPIVQALRWSIFKETGQKMVLLHKTGTTYTNILQEHYSKNNPDFVCITYGPGDPRLEHTDSECISLVEYQQCINVYERFIPKFAEMCRKKQEQLNLAFLEEMKGCSSAQFDIFFQ